MEFRGFLVLTSILLNESIKLFEKGNTKMKEFGQLEVLQQKISVKLKAKVNHSLFLVCTLISHLFFA
jgi:hypothetical protein